MSICDLLAELVNDYLSIEHKSPKMISLLPSWQLLKFGLWRRDDKWAILARVNQAQVIRDRWEIDGREMERGREDREEI